jgi:hypothetical protein
MFTFPNATFNSSTTTMDVAKNKVIDTRIVAIFFHNKLHSTLYMHIHTHINVYMIKY